MGNPVENLMLTDLPLPSPVRQLTDDAEGAKCLVEIFIQCFADCILIVTRFRFQQSDPHKVVNFCFA